MDWVFYGDSKPKVIVFTDRKGFVESSFSLKQIPGHHHRRWAHQAKVEAGAKDISRRLAMSPFRIYPDPPAYPDLLGLADLDLRPGLHKCHLGFQLPPPPQVIGIQEGQILAGRAADP